MTERKLLALTLVGAIAVASCGGNDSDDDASNGTTTTVASSTTTAPSGETTTTVPPPDLPAIGLDLEEVDTFEEPVDMATRPGTPDLYVAEKAGRILRVEVTESESGPRYSKRNTPLLDISDEVINQGEQGLLGFTFSSDGRKLYVHYSLAPEGDTRILEYVVGDSNDVDESTRRELLALDQPAPNHNGGQLTIGPDGYLYVGLGDGGGCGDPNGNAQNPDVLLGKILRLDPEGSTGVEGEPPYAIPSGNPFAAGGGRPEVWLLGARNPWRFSFDTATGDLWIADVGQNEWEEINLLPSVPDEPPGRGANLGWDLMEGTHEFEGPNPPDAILPVHEYDHSMGCSVTGGYVYRGTAIPALVGTYLFADYCAPGLRGIVVRDGKVVVEHTWDLPISDITSFGQAPDGEVYVMSQRGPVWRIVPAGQGAAEE